MNLMKRFAGLFTTSPQRVWVGAIVFGMILTPVLLGQNLFAQDAGEASDLKGLRPTEERPAEKDSVPDKKPEAETKKQIPIKRSPAKKNRAIPVQSWTS